MDETRTRELSLEAGPRAGGVDPARLVLARYDRDADRFNGPRLGAFWESVALAHEMGRLGQGRRIAVIDRCEPGNRSSGPCRLVQRDDAATTFDAEYLSQREAAAEDLMLACRMTRGIGPDLLVRSASVIAADELAAACDRAVELGLATWVPDHIEGHAGRVTSKDVIAGRAHARLAPTHLGWLDGNVLFELFWGLA